MAEPNTFSVVSFNVKVGGIAKSRDTLSTAQIAGILSRGDIAGVQEVTHRTFARALKAQMRKLGNYNTQYIELPENADKEEGLFTYNADAVQFLDHYTYPNKKKYFRRTPVTGLFQVGHKMLGVMDYHAEFGRGNKKEITKLPYALDDTRKHLGIENIILTADTNLGSEAGGLKNPYFSDFGMKWPQAFPLPGVDTTNSGYIKSKSGKSSGGPTTYDYIIWDGAHLISCGGSLIKFNEKEQFLINLIDSSGVLSFAIPGVRKRLRNEVTGVSDHWGLRTEFYLKNDYSIYDLVNMKIPQMIGYGAIRAARSLTAKKYGFPKS